MTHLRKVTMWLGAYAVVGGLTSFMGWGLDIPRLADWDNDGITIQPNATVAAMAAGAALLLIAQRKCSVAAALGALAALVGGSALVENLLGVDFGIDTLLMFERTWGRIGVLSPGRMGPPGAVSWTLLGSAIMLASLPAGSPARRFAPLLASITASLSLLALVGYLYGASPLYTIPTLTIIALQTATFVFAVSLGVMMSVPERAPIRLFAEDGPAGLLARRIVPAVVLIPILLGMLRLMGERAGLYDGAFGSALRSVTEIGLLLLLLFWVGAAINRQFRQRLVTDRALGESRSQLEEELRDSRFLQIVSTELIRQEDPLHFYESIMDAAVGIMRSDFASLQMFYPDRAHDGELVLLASRGFTAEAATFWQRVRTTSDSTCGVALREGKRIIVPDLEQCDFIVETEDEDMYRRTGIRAVQSTPLMSRAGTLVGMISTHWRNVHQPSERSLGLIDILARQAADLLERKRSESQREILLERERAARSEAERSARLKDEFLATLSHELRTPLNAVVGWSRLLKKSLTQPDKVSHAADVIERNARLQAQLISDLLDMSRISAGKMNIEVKPVDLSAIVDEAIDSMRLAADAKGVRVQRRVDAVDEVVFGDAAKLQQVIWNLLSNAVKFTPNGGCVQVELAKHDDRVAIRVTDTGEGIDPEIVSHIFERFRQGDATTSRRHGGLGLGLAIVKHLVELHGGNVNVASAGIGKGSSFTIELPIGNGASAAWLSRFARVPEATLPRLRGMLVLVVDDEPDSLELVRRVLEEREARVETATSFREALRLLEIGRFDVIVSDLGMPERDGYELMCEVRARGIPTPAIALTAFARPEDRGRALEVGYQAHIAKPVETSDLIALVASLGQLSASPQPG